MKVYFLGPVIRDTHKERTLDYIEKGVKEGATMVRDGRKDEELMVNGILWDPLSLTM